MYRSSYFFIEEAFAVEYGLYGNGISPFRYNYELFVIYASLKDNKKALDLEKRIKIDLMEEQDDDYQKPDGYYTKTGVFLREEKINRRERNTYLSYGSYQKEYLNSDFKFPETDGRYLWVYTDNKEEQAIECLDMQTDQKIWAYHNSEYRYPQNTTPTKIGDVLVHNLGFKNSRDVDDQGKIIPTLREESALIGIELETGKKLWCCEFPFQVFNYINVDGRIILSTMNFMVELDPVTGQELKRVDTQLTSGAVHDIEDHLLFISSVDKTLSVHNRHTLEQMQVIELPKEPVSYGIDDAKKPIKYKNTWNMSVGAGYQEADRPSNDMLMQISLCEPGEQPTSTIEEKPPHTVSIVPEANDEESYRIDLEAQTPDHLIRFAEIEISLIPAKHGDTMWGAPAKNKKFNGCIAFYGILPTNTSEADIERTRSYLKLLEQHWQRVAEGDMGPYGSTPGSVIVLKCYLNGDAV